MLSLFWALILVNFVVDSDAIAHGIMGIDLGHLYMKVCICFVSLMKEYVH